MAENEANIDADPVVVPADPPKTVEKIAEDVKKIGKVQFQSTKTDTSKMSMRDYVKHLSLWADPLLSAKYLFGVSMLCYFTQGSGSHSVAGFVTLVLLERTLLVFGLASVAHILKAKDNAILKKIGEGCEKSSEVFGSFFKLPKEEDIRFWTKGIGEYLEAKIINGFSVLKKAESDIKALKVVLAHLTVFILVFMLFSISTIVFTSMLIGLVIPPIYSRQSDKIDPLLGKAHEAAKPHVETIKGHLNKLLETATAKLEEAKAKATEKVNDITHKDDAKIKKEN